MTAGDGERVFITGGDGFLGGYLARALLDRGCQVGLGVRAGRAAAVPAGGAGAGAGAAAERFEVELPDGAALEEALGEFRPRAVIHLAAVSFLPEAENDPALAERVNVEGTRALIEALDRIDPARRMLLVLASSAHVYRPGGGPPPLDEEAPLEPATVYGRTKLAAEQLCRSCAAAGENGRPLVIFRSFNLAGPGQRALFAISSFARQIARIEAGLQQPVVEAGDLDVERDFTDVRDAAGAYRLAAEGKVPPGIYNLASGRAASMRRILDLLRSLSGRPVEVSSAPALARPGEVRRVVGSPARLERACGWRVAIPIERTLADVLDGWRRDPARGATAP